MVSQMNLRVGFALYCLFAVSGGLNAASAPLLQLAISDTTAVRLLPQSANERVATMEAVELRAPQAVTEVVTDGVHERLANDNADYFLGVDAQGTRWGLLHRDGVWTAASGQNGQLTEYEVRWEGDRAILRVPPAPSEPLHSSCGTDSEMALASGVALPVQMPPLSHLAARASAGVLGTATLAIDTDTEWLSKRFANNTTSASAWVDQMILQMNVIYERDLNLRTLRGTTFLRVGTDPFNNNDSPATLAQLTEFGTYWQNNQAGVQRAFALLLSGKSPNGFSANGIAWLDRYCDHNVSGGASYSINQVFHDSSVPVSSSLRIIAHEIGHNLGSVHTHCYNPPVDQCFTGEPSCYTGSVSCPGGPGNPGTLMSYCNFGAPNGANCGSNQLLLHPTVITRLTTRIAANTPACIVPLGGGDELFEDGFE